MKTAYQTAAETIAKAIKLLDQIWNRSCPPKATPGPAQDGPGCDKIPTLAEMDKWNEELGPDLQDNLHASTLLQQLSDEIAADMIGVLDWHYTYRTEDGMPDDDTRVFVAVRGEEHLIEAFHEAFAWIEDGTLEPLEGVYAWAHIPELPLDLEEAAKEEGIAL